MMKSFYILCTAVSISFLNTNTLALEDPTRPPDFTPALPDEQKTAVQHWELQSILISPGRRVAVVNGKSVAVGQHIDGARITQISAGQVDLWNNGELLSLKIIQGIKKMTVNEKATP